MLSIDIDLVRMFTVMPLFPIHRANIAAMPTADSGLVYFVSRTERYQQNPCHRVSWGTHIWTNVLWSSMFAIAPLEACILQMFESVRCTRNSSTYVRDRPRS